MVEVAEDSISCRTSDNKCGCDDDTECGSNEVCYSEHCLLAPSTSRLELWMSLD